MEAVTVNGKEYKIIKLLGKGKGGYSYLGEYGGKYFVVKKIHHEPCSFYRFGDKMQAEINDYRRLSDAGVLMPKMIFADKENEIIIKEYIEGETVYALILNDKLPDCCIEQIKQICDLIYPKHINIDYFPTNFILNGGLLFYIDYECNEYMEEWNFENWGVKYWSKTPEFIQYAKDHA